MYQEPKPHHLLYCLHMTYIYKTNKEELEKLTQDVKRDVMYFVISDMRKQQLSMSQAREIAKDLLAIFPVESFTELMDKLRILGDIYMEVRAVFIKYAKVYYEKQKAYVLGNISELLAKEDIDGALNLVKGGTIHG